LADAALTIDKYKLNNEVIRIREWVRPLYTERPKIGIVGTGIGGSGLIDELREMSLLFRNIDDLVLVQMESLNSMGPIWDSQGFEFDSFLEDGGKDGLEGDLIGRDWLDRNLMMMNPAYSILRNMPLETVKWAAHLVLELDMVYIISELKKDALDLCLLIDALCTKFDRNDILFLVRPDSILESHNIRYYNNRTQHLSLCSDCAIMTPELIMDNPDDLAEIIIGLHKVIFHTGTVNIDLADVRSIAGSGNVGMIGVGRGKGLTKAEQASKRVVKHPMIDIDISWIRRLIICVEGGADMTINESKVASQFIKEKLKEEAKIIWGAYVNPKMSQRLDIVLLVGLTANQALTRKLY